MTISLIRRLVWKEFRELFPIWFAVLLFGLTLGTMIALIPSVARQFSSASVFGALGCLFALGAGATLFSNDHENGTARFLACQPIQARKLAFVKLAIVLIGLLAVLSIGFGFWMQFRRA